MDDEVNTGLERITCAVSFCLCAYILKRECSNRSTTKKLTQTPITRNRYQCTLDIWASLTLICAILVPMLYIIGTIPAICRIFSKIACSAIWFTRLIVTFYQIARLHIAFNINKYIQNDMHIQDGYFIFYMFLSYLHGIVLLTMNQRSKFICVKQSNNHDIFYILVIYLAGPLYYIWDFAVLILYIIKIIQIKNTKKEGSSPTTKEVYNEVMNEFILVYIKYYY